MMWGKGVEREELREEGRVERGVPERRVLGEGD